MKLNYAIDLDGCLAVWEKDAGYDQATGRWMDDAQEVLRELFEDPDTGTVVVHTCRATWPAGGSWPAVAEFIWSGGFRAALVTEGEDDKPLWTLLERPGLPQPDGPTLGIWLGRGKPVAHVYIDDRGVRFLRVLGWRLTIKHAKEVALGAA